MFNSSPRWVLRAFYYIFIVNVLFKTPDSESYYFNMNFSFLAGEDGGIIQILTTFITNPLAALNYSFEMADRLFIFFMLLFPVLFLPVFTKGRIILMGAVLVVFGFLDINASNLRIGNQYSVYIIPMIYYLTLIKLEEFSLNKRVGMILTMLMLSIYTARNHDFFQPNLYDSYQRSFVMDHIRKQKHRACLEKLPQDKKYSIAAPNFYTPHLSMRDSIFTLDSRKRPDLWIYSTNATHDHRFQEEMDETQAIISLGQYKYLHRSEGDECVILQRRDLVIQ
ncbi:MAG: DUF2079 domain-containing protein [Bacteroidota bacterium]